MISVFRHSVLIVLTCLFSQVSIANTTFDEGVKAHSENNYVLAIEKFTETINETPNNVSAYYNLGLSNMGNKSYGAAIWAFEKVLKFSPNDSEAKEKIEFCHNELYPSEEWSPILGSFESGIYSISSNAWSLAAILCSILLCICIILLKRKKAMSIKRIMLISSFFSAILMITALIIASKSKAHQESVDYAIITQPTIPTFIDEKNTAKTNLSEGIRLQLIDKDSSEYVNVQDNMGDQYLVKYEDLTLI